MSRETLYRWLREPTFQQAVRSAEAQALDDLSRLLQLRELATLEARLTALEEATGIGEGPR